jgi:hypothetical protein
MQDDFTALPFSTYIDTSILNLVLDKLVFF